MNKTQLLSIDSIEELRKHLNEYALVAVDIEGISVDLAFEVGLAISPPSGLLPRNSYAPFVRDNNIKCHTIRLRRDSRNRRKWKEALRFGSKRCYVDEDPERTVQDILSPYSSCPLMLVNFGHDIDLKWMQQRCPTVMGKFTAIVDVQKLVANASTGITHGLRPTLKVLGLDEGVQMPKTIWESKLAHRGVNDAVYTLALLAALVSRPSDAPRLEILSPKRPVLFAGRPPKHRYPFTALIRTTDGAPLPPELGTAPRIFRLFEEFRPRTAARGVRKGSLNTEEQRSWCWISSNLEDLERFIASEVVSLKVNQSLIVENWYIPGVTLTKEERITQRLRNRGTRQEEKRRWRLEIKKAAEEGLELGFDFDF